MSAASPDPPAPRTLLSLDQVTTYYGQMRILEGISLHVGEGELVCLLGGNASGKSTTLKTILGIVRPRAGRVVLNGQDVTKWPVPRRIAAGMAIVPENRRLFGQLTVRENLELGAVLRKGGPTAEDFDRVHELFPRLLERRGQLAGTLSGGEQQMVAMGRGLMSRPRLLLMDEPSMGLSPALVQQNFQIIKTIHASGVAVLMVEQNATMALSIADRGYVLSTGEIVLEGPAAELLRDEELKRAYLGGYLLLVHVGLLGERVLWAEDERGVHAFGRLLLRGQLRTRRGVEHVNRRVSAAARGHRCHGGRIALRVGDPELEVVVLEELDVHDRRGIVMHPCLLCPGPTLQPRPAAGSRPEIGSRPGWKACAPWEPSVAGAGSRASWESPAAWAEACAL